MTDNGKRLFRIEPDAALLTVELLIINVEVNECIHMIIIIASPEFPAVNGFRVIVGNHPGRRRDCCRRTEWNIVSGELSSFSPEGVPHVLKAITAHAHFRRDLGIIHLSYPPFPKIQRASACFMRYRITALCDSDFSQEAANSRFDTVAKKLR